ncbi:MAG: efflux RND transporter periplasmic adaptor subunit, partial [Candidatus Omnitrophica bacterium]|nr:efflux RND transporter periplasmic adaptor subunit [Candidatus Omnitrophota bacterium]
VSDIKERALSLVESSKRKLQLLGLSNEQIAELEETREAQSGLVLPEKKMWIYGDVYEYELSWVKSGEKLEIKTQAFPGEIFSGTISSINPVLDPKTRAVRFRAEVENPDLKLKPEMYVDVVIKSMYVSPQGEHMVLAIPDKAVLDTGARKIVWVYKGNDEYEGRDIEVGPQASAETGDKGSRFYPVLKGLSEGEDVVTKANFLIDSQSQITGITASAYGGALGTEEKKASPAHQH